MFIDIIKFILWPIGIIGCFYAFYWFQKKGYDKNHPKDESSLH